jgi:hypothetical protein
MNEQTMESILRKAPAPKAPAGLEEWLVAGIRLEAGARRQTGSLASTPWWKRWAPTLAYGGLAATCLAIIGTQERQLAKLQSANEALRAQCADLSALREANAEVERLRAANADLARLRQDNADIGRLRDEIAGLRAESEGLDGWKAENLRLKTLAAATIPGSQPDFFAEANDRAARISCVNNLKQIGLAARIWANAHDGDLPPDFGSMTNELANWRVLQCPSDKTRKITSWAQVAAGDVSYQIEATGLNDGKDNSQTVVYECPAHRIVCLLDGSVQMLSAEGMSNSIIIDKLGHKVFQPGRN